MSNMFQQPQYVGQAQQQDGLSLGLESLDPFLMEGDDETWNLDDWNWDPYNLFAAPKEQSKDVLELQAPCCSMNKRKASEVPMILQPPQQQARCCNANPHALLSSLQPPAGPQPTQLLSAASQARQTNASVAGKQSCCSFKPPAIAPSSSQPAAVSVTDNMMSHLQHNRVVETSGPGGLCAGPDGVGSLNNAWSISDVLLDSLIAADVQVAGPATLQMPALNWPRNWRPSQQNDLCSNLLNPISSQIYNQPIHSNFSATCHQTFQPSLYQQQNQVLSAGSPNSSAEANSSNPMSNTTNLGLNQLQRGTATARAPEAGGCHNTSSKEGQPKGSCCHNKVAAKSTAHGVGVVDDGHSDADLTDEDDKELSGEPAYYGNAVVLHDVDDNSRMTCQVPGCGKELSGLKDYHQRYRICEVHIKLPQVLKDSRLQRFCQQCGRFHDLTAFDGARKSCREQLSKHNARRRRRAQVEHMKGRSGGADNKEMAGLTGGATDGEFGKLLSSLMGNPEQLRALRLLLGVQTHPALPAMKPYDPEAGDAGTGPEPPTYGKARDILAGRFEYQPSYESDHRVLRVSMKLFNRTPSDLPKDLRQQVVGWAALSPAGMEGCIRPGCVFLTLSLLLDAKSYARATASGVYGLVNHLLHETGCAFWWQGTYAVQLLDSIAMVQEGQLTSMEQNAGCMPGHPSVQNVSPLAVPIGEPATLELTGSQLTAGCEVVLRCRGKHIKTDLQADPDGKRAYVHLPAMTSVGTLHLELTRGAYASESKPILVVDSSDVAAEVNTLFKGCPDAVSLDTLLVDLGMVMEHLAGRGRPDVALADVVEKARRLVAFACDMGWAALVVKVLPLAVAGCESAADVVAAIHTSTARGGLSLLHRAVRSGNLALVQGMLGWGVAHGYTWRVDISGPGGITPLHLAALLSDARMAVALLDHCNLTEPFTRLAAADDVTPFHLAFQMGHFTVDQLLGALQVPLPLSAASRRRRRSTPEDPTDCELDPCESCHSTLPPLMLNIAACCPTCGAKRPCLAHEPMKAGHGFEHATCSCCGGTKYNITALCQACHSDRVLQQVA